MRILASQNLFTIVDDSPVVHTLPTTLIPYTHECANVALSCELVVAASRAANNRNARVQIRLRFHVQKLASKVNDTLVAHSQSMTSTFYTHEGVNKT